MYTAKQNTFNDENLKFCYTIIATILETIKSLKKSKLSVTTTMLTYLRVDDDFLYEVDYQPG